jgi:hypothetical protein
VQKVDFIVFRLGVMEQMCVDYKALNKVKFKNMHYLLCVYDLFNQLLGYVHVEHLKKELKKPREHELYAKLEKC